jgi:hypothetical protein
MPLNYRAKIKDENIFYYDKNHILIKINKANRENIIKTEL